MRKHIDPEDAYHFRLFAYSATTAGWEFQLNGDDSTSRVNFVARALILSILG